MHHRRRRGEGSTLGILQDLLPRVPAIVPFPDAQHRRRGIHVERVVEGLEELKGPWERSCVDIPVSVDREVIEGVVDVDVLDLLELIIFKDAVHLHALAHGAGHIDKAAMLRQAIRVVVTRRNTPAALVDWAE